MTTVTSLLLLLEGNGLCHVFLISAYAFGLVAIDKEERCEKEGSLPQTVCSGLMGGTRGCVCLLLALDRFS